MPPAMPLPLGSRAPPRLLRSLSRPPLPFGGSSSSGGARATARQTHQLFSPRLAPTPTPNTPTPTPTAVPRRPFRLSARRRATAGGDGPRKAAEPEEEGLSARLRKLSREYGWAAVGVYLGLSVLDFPFCFMAVRVIGTEKIAQVEHWIASFLPEPVKNTWRSLLAVFRKAEEKERGDDRITEKVEMAGWGVREAEAANDAGASLATQLALAYAIHKSFIFVRVPLTAAILPKVVRVLRSWGWKIGKRAPK